MPTQQIKKQYPVNWGNTKQTQATVIRRQFSWEQPQIQEEVKEPLSWTMKGVLAAFVLVFILLGWFFLPKFMNAYVWYKDEPEIVMTEFGRIVEKAFTFDKTYDAYKLNGMNRNTPDNANLQILTRLLPGMALWHLEDLAEHLAGDAEKMFPTDVFAVFAEFSAAKCSFDPTKAHVRYVGYRHYLGKDYRIYLCSISFNIEGIAGNGNGRVSILHANTEILARDINDWLIKDTEWIRG